MGSTPTRIGVRRGGDSRPGMSPQFLLNALLHWWKLAAPVGLILALVSAGTVWWLFEPTYLANAVIQIRETAPALVFDVEKESKSYVETQKETIRSSRVLRPVVTLGDIKNMPELRDADDKVRWLRSQLKLSLIGKSEYLQIGIEGPDGDNAARIVNAVVDQ